MKHTIVVRVQDRMLITLVEDEVKTAKSRWFTLNILKGNEGGDAATYRQVRLTDKEIELMADAIRQV